MLRRGQVVGAVAVSSKGLASSAGGAPLGLPPSFFCSPKCCCFVVMMMVLMKRTVLCVARMGVMMRKLLVLVKIVPCMKGVVQFMKGTGGGGVLCGLLLFMVVFCPRVVSMLLFMAAENAAVYGDDMPCVVKMLLFMAAELRCCCLWRLRTLLFMAAGAGKKRAREEPRVASAYCATELWYCGAEVRY